MELEEEITPFVRTRVALGKQPCATIVEEAVDHLLGLAEADAVEAAAWRVAEAEFAAHVAAQRTWDVITDNDRLTLAFSALDAAGIVARESFTCCQTCGNSEIGGEAAPGARGYVFYHQQDAEGAVEGGLLHLAYGSFCATEDARVGAEIAQALTRQGLTVQWNGDVAERIRVPIRWQRRRTGDLAEVPLPGQR
jgi:hypothetical protein